MKKIPEKNETLRRKGDLNSRGVTTSGFQDHRLPRLDYLGTYTCRCIFYKYIPDMMNQYSYILTHFI